MPGVFSVRSRLTLLTAPRSVSVVCADCDPRAGLLVTSEELNAHAPLRRAFGAALVAVICVLSMHQSLFGVADHTGHPDPENDARRVGRRLRVRRAAALCER